MSTATLNGLLEYLYATLTPSNQKWLGEHLIEHAKHEEDPLRPYTKEELLQMAETGRKQIADGYYYTTICHFADGSVLMSDVKMK